MAVRKIGPRSIFSTFIRTLFCPQVNEYDALIELIAGRGKAKVLLYEQASDTDTLPVCCCPTCNGKMNQASVFTAERHFIPKYCMHCGQKLEPRVRAGQAYPADMFYVKKSFVPVQEGVTMAMSSDKEGIHVVRASVDAVERGIVRIVFQETGEAAALPLATLPEGIREGDIIYQDNGVWLVDAGAGEQKKDELQSRLDRLLGRGNKQ